MAYVRLPSGLWAPNVPFAGAHAYNSALAMDANGEKVSIHITAPKDGTLDSFEFNIGAFTQCTNGLRISFQPPNTSGDGPDGTVQQYRNVTPTGTGWVSPGLLTSDGTDSGTKRTVQAGETFFAVIEFASWAAGNNIVIYGMAGEGQAYCQLPTTFLYTSSWAPSQYSLCGALKYSDGYERISPIHPPLAAAPAEESFMSTTDPDERGIIIQFPVKVKIGGAWVMVRSTAGTADLKIYSGTTLLRSYSHDWDQMGYGSSSRPLLAFFDELELEANTPYRLTWNPTSANSNYILGFTPPSAAHLRGYTYPEWTKTTRNDGGDWTDDTSASYYAGVMISSIDNGAGGDGAVDLPEPLMIGV